MREQVILLVEDNPDDELLMLRALAKNDFTGGIVVVRDGVEALDYLFASGDRVRFRPISGDEFVRLSK